MKKIIISITALVLIAAIALSVHYFSDEFKLEFEITYQGEKIVLDEEDFTVSIIEEGKKIEDFYLENNKISIANIDYGVYEVEIEIKSEKILQNKPLKVRLDYFHTNHTGKANVKHKMCIDVSEKEGEVTMKADLEMKRNFSKSEKDTTTKRYAKYSKEFTVGCTIWV